MVCFLWNTSAKFNRNFSLFSYYEIFCFFFVFFYLFFFFDLLLIYCYDKCHCLLNEKESLGRAFFLPRIRYCSSRMRFSCSRCMRCRSSSILRCCSTIAKRSSASFRWASSIFLLFSSTMRSSSSRLRFSSSCQNGNGPQVKGNERWKGSRWEKGGSKNRYLIKVVNDT